MDIHEITLKRQIDFNNQWPKIKILELESVEKFGQKLSDCKLEQLLVPMHWDEDKTFALFTRSHALAKIFSSTLDMYEVLPFSPDIAFDIIWRALEISMKFMSQNSWGYTSKRSFEDVLNKTCTDIIAPLANHEPCIKELFESIIEKVIVGGYDEDGNKDPYKITFIYKTGFKNEIGNAKERFDKSKSVGDKAKELCSHIVNEVKDVCSYVSDNTCGDGCSFVPTKTR